MLIWIPDVLDWTELKKIREAVAEGEFADGKKTAGYRAKRVKDNLQLDKSSKGAKEIKDTILSALRRNPTFQKAALPKTMPSFSRFHGIAAFCGWWVTRILTTERYVSPRWAWAGATLNRPAMINPTPKPNQLGLNILGFISTSYLPGYRRFLRCRGGLYPPLREIKRAFGLRPG